MLDKLPDWLLLPVFWLATRWGWLNRIVNRIIINTAVNYCRARPHPWSTVHDYVSWTSLTNRTYSARHLPVDTVKRHRSEPEDIALLFGRTDQGPRLCPKSTCLFPAFAQYLTDGFIRTRMPKSKEAQDLRLQTTSNHQIDLCPLYGLNPKQTNALRVAGDAPHQRGKLKSQMINGEEFAPFLCDNGIIKTEFKDLDEPLRFNDLEGPEFQDVRNQLFAFGGDRVNISPLVAAMNTLFLREHNRLAQEISKQEPDWDSDRVFETARATNIVCFIKIVVEDYINHIVPYPFRLSMDPAVAA